MIQSILGNIILKRSKLAFAVFVAAVLNLSTGCSDDKETSLPEFKYAGAMVSVQFNLGTAASAPASRADSWSDDEGHTEEAESDAFENMINLGNGGGFRFLIFHMYEEGGVETSKLIFDSDCKKFGDAIFNYNITLGANMGYIVNASIPIVKNGFEVKPDGGKTRLRIAVFANTNGATLPSLTLYQSKWSDMPNGSDAKTNPKFTLTKDWYPDPEEDRYIPFYGWNDYEIDNSQLYQSEIYAPVMIESPLYLLRALAKIEIIDHIRDKNAEGYPKVTAVECAYASGYTAFQLIGYMVPFDFVPMRQVSKITAPVAGTGTSSKDRGKLLFKNYSGVNPAVEGDETVEYWRTYCPEQAFTKTSGTGGSQRTVPEIKVTVVFSPTKSETYLIALDGAINSNYTNYDKFEGINSILRNHIYRIVINSAELSQDIEFEYKIAEFDEYKIDKIIFGGN